jgi:hypothetical protein
LSQPVPVTPSVKLRSKRAPKAVVPVVQPEECNLLIAA